MTRHQRIKVTQPAVVPERLVAGLMSGTSLDGTDAVIASITGHGSTLEVKQHAFVEQPYDPALRALLSEAAAARSIPVATLSQLNVRLAHEYARVVDHAAKAAGKSMNDLDLVGSHGQTIRHLPDGSPCAGLIVRSTFQIGDPAVLANLVHIPVVGDFRPADMALGGQGAPIVPYYDYMFFADERESRLLVNIGGIANVTVLPAGADTASITAFDTGPGNILIDGLACRFLQTAYDSGGRTAASGTVLEHVLRRALQDRYFARTPPKTTGRQYFGARFLERFLQWGDGASPADLLATATELTAASIHVSCDQFAGIRPNAVILSGGGSLNGYLVDRVAVHFDPVGVHTSDTYGIGAKAKEALCMAVLAHETMNAVPTGMPSVTGASAPAILGKICLPPQGYQVV